MSMMALQGPLRGANIAFDAWREEMVMRGQKVERFRRYRDGDYDANLTPEMRRALRVKPNPDNSNEFGINYCETVVSTYVDRLNVQTISSDKEEATAFIQEVMRLNRFDGLQIDVHDAAAVDADTYLMVHWDNEKKRVKWTQEAAYDGTEGMVPVYARNDRTEMYAAVKFWQETMNSYADTLRVNIYFADRVERFTGSAGGTGGMTRMDVQPNPVGMVPVVPFANRARGNAPYGLSELESVVPLQDSLNRTLHSMIMASEMSAFQIRYAIGTKAPQALTPGMFLEIYARDASGNETSPTAEETEWLKAIRYGAFEQGDIGQYLAQAKFIIEQIHDVTKTPKRGTLASTVSGEALKQEEIGLVSKARRAQTKFGNSWERAALLSVLTQNAFGRQAQRIPDAEFFCEWRDAEVRNDAQTLDMALKVADLYGAEMAIKLSAKAFDLSPEQVAEIIEARAAEEARRLQTMAFTGVNGFGLVPGQSQPGNGETA